MQHTLYLISLKLIVSRKLNQGMVNILHYRIVMTVMMLSFLTDVYSYDEDDMVLDPHLDKHLAHFGINIRALEKVIYLNSTCRFSLWL